MSSLQRWHWMLIGTTLLSGVVAVGCSDDDSAAPPGTMPDGGGSSGTNGTSGGTTSSSASSGGPDAGGACTFAAYVIDLINTQTTATAAPTADLGDKCAPSESQADFKPLFP